MEGQGEAGGGSTAGGGSSAGMGGEAGGVSYDDLVAATVPEAPETPEPGKEPEPKEGEGGPEPEKKPDEKPEPEKKPEKKPAGSKLWQGKTKDGKVLDVPDDVVFIKKIDGKEVEVTLGQALRHEAFDIPHQAKLMELKERESALSQREAEVTAKESAREGDLQAVAGQLRQEVEILAKEDIRGFIYEWCKLRQIPNPARVEALFRQHFLVEAGVDAEDIKTLEESSRTRYGELELKDAQGALALQQRQQRYESYVAKELSRFDVSEADWKEARQALQKEHLNGKRLVDLEPADFEKFVEAAILQARVLSSDNRISGLIHTASPELKAKNPKEFERLNDIIRRFSDYADEDIVEVLKANLPGGEGEEDEADPIDDDQLQAARRKPASNSNDDELERVRREVEESDDPFMVYR